MPVPLLDTLALVAALDVNAPSCAPVTVMDQALRTQFNEAPVARGRLPGEASAVLYHNPETSTWTLVVVAPTGVACLLASGEAWKPWPSSPPSSSSS